VFLKRGITAAAGIGLVVVLAGCGDSKPAAAAPPSSPSTSSAAKPVPVGADAVAWMNGFCGAVTGLTKPPALSDPPVTAGDLPATKKVLDDNFAQLANFVNSAYTNLTKLAPSPIPAGETAKKDLVDSLAPVRDRIADARRKLDVAPAATQQTLLEGGKNMDAVLAGVNALGSSTNDLPASPELASAAGQAANCKQLAG
jgi:hypothetical protein